MNERLQTTNPNRRTPNDEINELFEKEEVLSQELSMLEKVVKDLENRAITIASESVSSASSHKNPSSFMIYSNGMKIDNKVKRIIQTLRNLRLFRVILNQNHGNFSLAPITINKHLIILNYTPHHLLSRRRVTEGVYKLDYQNGDVAYEYRNGTILIETKQFTFIKYENGDEKIQFPDNVVSYYYGSTRTLEYTDQNQTTIRIFASGREELHFFRGKKYIFDINGDFAVYDQDGDERLRRKFDVSRIKPI